jgi:hypothetical protein
MSFLGYSIQRYFKSLKNNEANKFSTIALFISIKIINIIIIILCSIPIYDKEFN